MKRSIRLSVFAACSALLIAALAPTAHAQDAGTKYADLTGALDGFKLRTLPSGMIKIQGKIMVENLSAVAAKNVHANIYLSDDQTLDPEDHVYTLNLSDYNQGKGKLKGKAKMVIPLKEKVASFVGTLIVGQYLLIQFDANNNTPSPADAHNVVVYGPIAAP